MRISKLAERTEVPVPTLKYYLREGLLHPGRATARTQAVYDSSHVERVRLVRALIESAGLSLGSVRGVLAVLDRPPATRHDLLGAAQDVLLAGEGGRGQQDGGGAASAAPPEGVPPEDPWSARASALVASRGWCSDDEPLVGRLAEQLRAAGAAGIDLSEEHLTVLADAADRVAAADIASVPAGLAAAVRHVVVGTLLTDPVLLTLRRLAQQRASAETDSSAAGEMDSRPGQV
ncbi:MerR family transcriptional regulator [Ruania albidiflava]|uniref:MerR family transcriptional regulator n=1 Tax=Ruania albidiflava TaxID=366586 RepID=UPI0023F0DE9E|nr:MerR family transcriptional regulator [Ruania albidiflava]